MRRLIGYLVSNVLLGTICVSMNLGSTLQSFLLLQMLEVMLVFLIKPSLLRLIPKSTTLYLLRLKSIRKYKKA